MVDAWRCFRGAGIQLRLRFATGQRDLPVVVGLGTTWRRGRGEAGLPLVISGSRGLWFRRIVLESGKDGRYERGQGESALYEYEWSREQKSVKS